MIYNNVDVLFDGLRFPEGNRWHDGAFWCSDMHSGQVFRCDPQAGGSPEEVMQIDGPVGGLDWLKGDLLVSSMAARQVLRLTDRGTVHVQADLSSRCDSLTNDLLVDPDTGSLYVGCFGYDLYAGEAFRPAPLYRVDAGGAVSIAAPDLMFPNTAVTLPGTRTLVVGETFGECLTAFDIVGDGELINGRTWAEVPGVTPDGCCVDERGGIWVATLRDSRFLRVVQGGAVTDIVNVPGRLAIDCAIGGPDGRTLFMSTADDVMPGVTSRTRRGRVEVVELNVLTIPPT